jgi:hypothetical protein
MLILARFLGGLLLLADIDGNCLSCIAENKIYILQKNNHDFEQF